ncbi:hypothetical protein NDU88_006837 [Pleurodeles waltl]|uniref:Uncharacterized protein n=1 Tax=Pleurodeles waltl TaxID=8319 RepID=A0AAV7LT42_PLEWA|nr:hypothetical protein NDU88_006837 [Pleurodeles waltl]
MGSEEKTNMGLLYTISEGLQGWSRPESQLSTNSGELCPQKDQRVQKEPSVDTPDEDSNPGSPRVGQDPSKPNGPKTHPRLAQLRSQIRAQLGSGDQSPGSRMMDLVDKARRRDLEDAASMDGSLADEGHAACHCQVPQTNGLPAEVDRRLQVGLASMRGEMQASLDLMRKELSEEMAALREELRRSIKPQAKKPSDLSHPQGQADKKPDQWKSVFRKVSRREEQEVKVPSKLEGQFKARSVPTLGSQQAPSRNQVLLRAMTTITAKNALAATMGQRSNSDPLEAPPGKVSQPPTIQKPPARAADPSSSSKANGKWNKKMNSQTVTPHPHAGGAPAAKPH